MIFENWSYIKIRPYNLARRWFSTRISSLDNPPLSFPDGENWSKRTILTRMGKLRSGLSSNIIIDTAVAAERIRNFNEKELGVSRRRTDKMGRGFSLTLVIFSFPSDIFAANWLRCCLSDIDRVLPICRNSGCERCEADQRRVRVDTMNAVEASDWRESDEFRFLCT